MGRREVPIHLLVKRAAACGTTMWRRGSSDFRATTCENCKHSISMADAEAKAALQPNRR